MLMIAILCFALAAVLGIILISYVLRDKPTPKGIVVFHGPIAATGIVLLIIYMLFHAQSPFLISLILFVFAALGGFILLFRDLTGKSVPKWLALLHGSLAVIAFIILIVFALFIQPVGT
jgi:hypothetical protein